MSIKVMSWVWEHAPTSKHSELLVLLVLADHANDDGSGCWPSVRTIGRRIRASDRTVQYALRDLEAKGLIRKGDPNRTAHHRPDQRPTVYDIALPRGAESAPGRPSGVQPMTLRGAEMGGYGVQRVAPEPSLNRQGTFNRGAATCPQHLLMEPCRGCAADRLVRDSA